MEFVVWIGEIIYGFAAADPMPLAIISRNSSPVPKPIKRIKCPFSLLPGNDEMEDVHTALPSRQIRSTLGMDSIPSDTDLFERINERGAAGDPDGAAAACDLLVSRLAGRSHQNTRELTARALFNKATVFRLAGRTAQAVAAFDDLLQRFSGVTESGVLLMLAMALFNKGIALRAAGQNDAANQSFSRLVQVFANSPIDEIRKRVANVLLMNAQDASSIPAKAIAACNDLLLRFAGETAPEWQLYIATALTMKGVALGDARRYEQAVVTFDGVLRRYSGSADGDVREQVARSLYLKGFILREYEPDAANAALKDLVSRFQQDASSTTRTLVQQAQSILDQLKASPPKPDPELRKILLQINYQSYHLTDDLIRSVQVSTAAAHALADPFELATLADLSRQWRSHAVWPFVPVVAVAGLLLFRLLPWPQRLIYRIAWLAAGACYGIFCFRQLRRARIVNEYRKAHLRLVAERVSDARAIHLLASALLELCRAENRPFCLFLRNFDLEAYTREAKDREAQEHVVSMSLGNFDPFERKIAAALSSRLPVIGISNPSVIRPDYRHAVPKLELPNESWRESLRRLITDASFIVMHLEKISPGVSTELDFLRQQNKNDQAVIVLPKQPASERVDPFEAAMSDYYGLATQASNAEKSNPLLASFSRVVYEEDLPFELLDLSPAFRDLLPPLPELLSDVSGHIR